MQRQRERERGRQTDRHPCRSWLSPSTYGLQVVRLGACTLTHRAILLARFKPRQFLKPFFPSGKEFSKLSEPRGMWKVPLAWTRPGLSVTSGIQCASSALAGTRMEICAGKQPSLCQRECILIWPNKDTAGNVPHGQLCCAKAFQSLFQMATSKLWQFIWIQWKNF